MKIYAGVGACLLAVFSVLGYLAVARDGQDLETAETVEFLTTDDALAPAPVEPVVLAPAEPAHNASSSGPALPVASNSSTGVAPLQPPVVDQRNDGAGTQVPAPAGSASGDQLSTGASGAGTPTATGDAGTGSGSTYGAGQGATGGSTDGSGTAGGTNGATPRPAPSPSATGKPAASVFEPLRNARPEFSRYADVPSAQLPMEALTTGGGGAPTPNPISGQFRMFCQYSHFSYDDPIVYPGQPGKSHLHMFFGNTEADANSTSDSLFNRGGGSCNGHELDRSGYWVPALMQGNTKTIVPTTILLYFKTNNPGAVQTFPKGLRVIAGASPSDPDGAKRYRWKCEDSIGRAAGTFEPINDGPFFDYIPDCRALGYETLGYIIDFPFCWDGKNLDSANHRSHMSFECGGSHPVVLPQLQYVVHYTAPPSNAGVHISSDSLECQTGVVNRCGTTLHGDWWNAWHEKTNQTWINECSRKSVVCQVPNISASTMLVGSYSFSGNPVLDLPAGSYVPGRD